MGSEFIIPLIIGAVMFYLGWRGGHAKGESDGLRDAHIVWATLMKQASHDDEKLVKIKFKWTEE